MVVEPKRHRFSLERYERMVEFGVFNKNDHVELIEGEIVEMAPNDPPHTTPIRRLARIFHGLGEQAVILVQMPIRMPPRSEPEPDLVISRPPDERYLRRHPEPGDILLVVEVMHTTHLFDRNYKLPLYARNGIREIWLVDVPAGTFGVYRDPKPEGYASVQVLERGTTVSPEAFPELTIAVDEVLPLP